MVSFSLRLIIRADRIIASIPRASIMLCIVNYQMFVEVAWKRAIYALIKKNTYIRIIMEEDRNQIKICKVQEECRLSGCKTK